MDAPSTETSRSIDAVLGYDQHRAARSDDDIAAALWRPVLVTAAAPIPTGTDVQTRWTS